MVFNIKGNDYRLIVAIACRRRACPGRDRSPIGAIAPAQPRAHRLRADAIRAAQLAGESLDQWAVEALRQALKA